MNETNDHTNSGANSVLIVSAGASPLFPESGQHQSVRCHNGYVVEIEPFLEPKNHERVIDARGGALIPGLHDHHIHLFATASARTSLDCTGLNEGELAAALQAAAASSSDLRAVNYHESVAGPLDRHKLDQWISHLPLRIQHSTGQMWFLNSLAIDQFGIPKHDPLGHPGIERSADGAPTGRLFRADALLASGRETSAPPDLSDLSRQLASWGITGVTDTSHNNSNQEFELLLAKQRSGELLQCVRLMGNERLTPRQETGIHTGELKLLLDEAALPDLDEFIDLVRATHRENRSVAVHCVTRIELAVVLSVFGAAGVQSDRIEHASVLPESTLDQIRDLGLIAVTQPGFIHSKGERYACELSSAEVSELYRLKSLLNQDIGLAISSDAPYGPLNPWLNMQCSVDRTSEGGQIITSSESLTPEQAIAAYCGSPDNPTVPRQIRPGEVADLTVLSSPWAKVREQLAEAQISATIRAGELIYESTD